MTAAAVLKFPTPKRVLESPKCPPLWMQVKLLQQAQREYPERFSRLQMFILGRAEAIALLGEDAPIDQQIEYLRYTYAMMQWHCVSVPAPYHVEEIRHAHATPAPAL